MTSPERPRVVVLTGAASGIGYATAQRFLAAGDIVVGLDVQDTVPDGITLHRLSVADKDAVDAALAAVGAEHGRVDVLLNVAGISQFGRISDIDVEEFDRVVAVNLRGVFLTIQAALPWLRAAGGEGRLPGCIVNVASITGIRAQPYTAAYAASKGGVVMLTKALAMELSDEGIRVNCVAPGMVQTPLVDVVAGKMTDDINPRLLDRMMSLLPNGWLTPEEIAEGLFYLSSPAARNLTGVALPMDGGMDC